MAVKSKLGLEMEGGVVGGILRRVAREGFSEEMIL